MATTSDEEAWRKQLRDRWITGVLEHRVAVLLVGLIVTLVSIAVASRLRVEPDLRALLPVDHPVGHAIDHVERNFGVVGSINVVVAGGSKEARHAFADALADELADDPMLRAVDHRFAGEFFVEHALFYLSEQDMRTLEDRVAAWQHYELCSAAPDLCLDEPDTGAAKALQEFIDAKRQEIRERTAMLDYYERDGIDALVVFLRPTESSANVDFAVAVVEHLRARVGEVHAGPGPWHEASEGDAFRYNLTGPYVVKANERLVIGRDTLRSGAVALLGVVLILYLLFRSTRAVVVLLVPLGCGVAWSLAFTELTLGHLNVITSLISSLIMGLGIDAGIHFLTIARREREDHETDESIRRAFGEVITPLLVASTTTASAFVVMATSDFLGFREFGIIATSGVALCLLAMITIYPALLSVTGIKRPNGPRREDGISHATRMLLARPGLVFAGVVVLTVVSAKGVDAMMRDGFERNGRLLQSEPTRAVVENDTFLVSEILGHDVHASVLAVRDWPELERIFALARSRHAKRVELGETLVADIVAAPLLMPPSEIDMAERHQRIGALTEDWSERTWLRLEGGEMSADPPPTSDDWESFEPVDPAAPEPPSADVPKLGIGPEDGKLLRKMLQAKPFGPEDLPASVLGRLRGDDGSWGIFAHPNYDAADIYTGMAFMAETELYADGRGVYVGEPTVYSTMYVLMNQEWPVIIGMATLLIGFLVFWQVRTLGTTIITMAPLVLAVWWTMGILGSFGIKFNLFNVPILPAILGIGIDNGVYLIAAIRRESSSKTGLHRSVDETGGAIVGATMTTVAGFGAFLVADNGGLRSIGSVAAIGVLMASLAAMLAVPSISALVQRRRERRGEL